MAKFAVNNKTYSATKVSLFMANYKNRNRYYIIIFSLAQVAT